ncbi:helix-turn-helix domain-containing protein [Kribbella sp. NBC_01245]|uniref:helix-turn-helix domain-containing protein n=1 Tax=Kribbella sp. NBC_01245 TaxID=2903578 RepID=UPI002E2DE079|nr:helix-turn-helix transcriptional regulator [Kribbella sp. NBC_01245]
MAAQWHELPEAQRAARHGDYGTLLKLARTALGLTQAQAGAMAGWSGTTISRYETGTQRLTDVAVLRHMARLFAIPASLFGLSVPGSTSAVDPADRVHSEMEDGDHVLRRDLLTGMVAVTGAALLPVSALAQQRIVADLDDLLFGSAGPSTGPVGLDRLSGMLASAKHDFAVCRYRELAVKLPGLIRTATATCDAQPHDDRSAARTLLSDGYALATEVLTKLHENGAAWATADRAVQAAAAAGDPRALARAQRLAAIVLRRSAHRDKAQDVVLDAARRFTESTALAQPGDAGFYASMLCTASYTAALTDKRQAAYDLLQESRRAVTEHGGSTFGNNDINLYGIGVARALGDFGQAVTYSHQVRRDLLGPPERHARYWEDTALAWWGRGRADGAFQAMLHAEHAAPQEVRYRPWAQQLTNQLLATGQTVGLSGLRDFASRIGLAA